MMFQVRYAKKSFIPLSTLVIIFLAISAVPDIDQLVKISGLRETSAMLSILLIFIFVMILVIEIAWLLIKQKSERIGSLLGFFLKSILAVINLIFKVVYIIPLSYMLSPVIQNINNHTNGASDSERFKFINQQIGKVFDDHYYPNTIDLKSIVRMLVQPTKPYPRWRFGLIFSKDSNFPTLPNRYDDSHILVHLTKDQENTILEYNIYELNNNKREKILSNYSAQAFFIKITNSSHNTNIEIYEAVTKTLLKKISMPTQKYMKIFAWADGQSDFELEMKLQAKVVA